MIHHKAQRMLRLSFALLFLFGLLSTRSAHAQAFGEVTGTTMDETRSVISKAQVTLTNLATGTSVKTQSNGAGIFVISSVQPGTYRLVSSAPGFADQTIENIVVAVSKSARADVIFHPSGTTETVTVNAGETQLDVDNGYKGQLIGTKEIEQLPLPTRNPLALMALTPGVQTALGASATNRGGSDGSVASSGYQVNGGVRTNFGGFSEFLVDGVTMTNPRDGTIIALPSAGAIQEFSVQSGVMSAEYGGTIAGVINYVTKPGGNSLHGNLFEHYRGSFLNTAPALPYTPARTKPLNVNNQYGGTVSGPVWIPKIYNGRDKSFFLVDYEGLRLAARSNSTSSVPTVKMRTGDFSEVTNIIYDPASSPTAATRTAFTGNVIPAGRITAFGTQLINLYPLPTSSGLTSNYVGLNRNYQTTDAFTLRGDQYIGQRHRLTFKWTRDEYNAPATTGIGVNDQVTQNVKIPTRNYTGTYALTISPRFLYTAVAGYTYFHRYFADPSNNTIGTAYFGYSVSPGLPSGSAINVRPSASIANYNAIGTGTPQDRYTTIRELSQILSMNLGHHFVRAGADIRIYKASGLVTSGSPTGTFGFATAQTSKGNATSGYSIASLLLGQADSINFDQEPNASATLPTTAFFIADDWKVTSNLKLNLGFRYQFTNDFIERANSVGWFDDTTVNSVVSRPGVYQYAGINGNPRGFTSGDKMQFAPRLGFAYTPGFWNGMTVVRGGIGVYNGPVPIYGMYSSAPGFNSIYNPIKANAYAAAAPLQSTYTLSAAAGPQGESAGLGQSISTNIIDRNMKAPRAVQWNLGIQQQMPWKMKFEVQYAANRGVHLLINQAYNLTDVNVVNQAIANQKAAGVNGTASAYLNAQVANPLAGKVPGTLGNATVTRQQAAAQFPQFGSITGLLGTRDSIYHSLQTTLQRNARNWTFLAAYTWGKLLTNSSPGSYAGQSNVGTVQNPYDSRDSRGVSDFDSTHIFAGTVVYKLPFGRGETYLNHGWASAIFGGFQLTSILKAQSGVPLAITQSTANGLGVGSARPDKIADPTIGARTRLPNGSVQWINPAAYAIADGHFGSAPIRDSQVRGPNYWDLDSGVQRYFHLYREAQLQFRAEAFNALNHTNLALPNSEKTSSTFGQITSSYDPRNLQLSLHLTF